MLQKHVPLASFSFFRSSATLTLDTRLVSPRALATRLRATEAFMSGLGRTGCRCSTGGVTQWHNRSITILIKQQPVRVQNCHVELKKALPTTQPFSLDLRRSRCLRDRADFDERMLQLKGTLSCLVNIHQQQLL